MARTSEAKNPGPAPVPPESRPAKDASKTGDTVTVACKLPHGIVLHREVKKSRTVNVLGGGQRDEFYFERVPDSEVRVYGTARVVGHAPLTRIVCGFALTQGVPKETWDQWRAANKDMPAVKNGLIFAYPTTALAADAAKDPDNKKLRSNLEPLNPDKDPRSPKPMRTQIEQIKTNDEVTHDFAEVDEEA